MELSKEGTVKEGKSINAEEHKFRQKSQKGQSRLIYSQILAVEQNDFVKRMRQTIHRLSQLNWFSHSNEFFIVFISINKQAKYHNQIIIKLMMLKATLRLFTLTAKTCLPLSNVTPLASSLHRPFFTFSQSHKHEKHDKEDHHHEKKHEKEHHEKKHDKEDSHQEKHKHHNPKQAHHQHGPGCKHDHGHHHESHQHSHHQHGPGCNHDHDHHDHHAAHPNVKLSKLSFQELIKLQTQESLKYAHMIYEQELKKLKELQETKEHVQKNIEFYKKLQKEIKEKEHKIEDNIKMYEQELALSTKRAEKQVDQSKSFAVTKIAKELLEVADCIANCKKFAEQSEHKDKYIDLIIQSKEVVRDILKKYEIEQFDPINQEYDPNYQESLLQIPTPPGCKEGHVAIVMRTGYKIKGRLLRSARVGVFN